jgi:transposase
MSEQKRDVFIGIDVSKDKLDVAVRPEGEYRLFNNTEDGLREMREFIGLKQPSSIVIEATGGYEKEAVRELALAGLPIVLVNPRQVRDFAKAIGVLAKTDKIDAEVIARFAEAVKPEKRALKTEEEERLDSLNARRFQIVEMITSEKNRLGHASKWTKEGIVEHISVLEKSLSIINSEMDDLIKNSPVWRQKDKVLRSIPGVGKVMSRTLLADMPEIGTMNRKQVSALGGVAPMNRDSGKYRGKRTVWGGRASVRAVLYMCALTGIRCNYKIKEFYNRLRASGKSFKVAITACMRKLLVIINSMIKHETCWAS